MLAAAKGRVSDKLAGQATGEFYLVRESSVTAVRSDESCLRTEQLAEYEIAELARQRKGQALHSQLEHAAVNEIQTPMNSSVGGIQTPMNSSVGPPARRTALGAPRRSETELFKMTIVWAWSLDVRRRTVRPVLSAHGAGQRGEAQAGRALRVESVMEMSV